MYLSSNRKKIDNRKKNRCLTKFSLTTRMSKLSTSVSRCPTVIYQLTDSNKRVLPHFPNLVWKSIATQAEENMGYLFYSRK